MSIVKINAITVPRERFDEFAERFASRAGKVEEADGFETRRPLQTPHCRAKNPGVVRDPFGIWLYSSN